MMFNSLGTIEKKFPEGTVVVCIYDHQLHDKLNYLNRYTVQYVAKAAAPRETHLSGVCLRLTGEDATWYPIEYFVTEEDYSMEINDEIKKSRAEARSRRMDDKAKEDPQPVVTRYQAEDSRKCPGNGGECKDACVSGERCHMLYGGLINEPVSASSVQEVSVAQAQQFENVPDMSALAAVGKLPANPKQRYGDKKPRLSLAPMSAQIAQVEAQLDGLLKYGWVNWRVNNVEAQTYIDAAMRHLRLYENGEEYARDTKVYNLGAVMACCAIIIDAALHGTLIDNRRHSPVTCDMLHDRGEAMVKLLQGLQEQRDGKNGN